MFHTPAHKQIAAFAAAAAAPTPAARHYSSNEIDAVRRRENDVGYDALTDDEKAILATQD